MIERITVFSPCREYRYALWREWRREELPFADNRNGGPGTYVNFIGLNPSTADEKRNDPTIRKCMEFARRWGYAGICMTNLFAYRATDPRAMIKHPQPEGRDNDKWLREIAAGASRIIAAWGKRGIHRTGSSHLFTVLDLPDRQRIECLRMNNDGSPEHPLYVPYSAEPEIYAK